LRIRCRLPFRAGFDVLAQGAHRRGVGDGNVDVVMTVFWCLMLDVIKKTGWGCKAVCLLLSG